MPIKPTFSIMLWTKIFPRSRMFYKITKQISTYKMFSDHNRSQLVLVGIYSQENEKMLLDQRLKTHMSLLIIRSKWLHKYGLSHLLWTSFLAPTLQTMSAFSTQNCAHKQDRQAYVIATAVSPISRMHTAVHMHSVSYPASLESRNHGNQQYLWLGCGVGSQKLNVCSMFTTKWISYVFSSISTWNSADFDSWSRL